MPPGAFLDFFNYQLETSRKPAEGNQKVSISFDNLDTFNFHVVEKTTEEDHVSDLGH